MSSMSKLLAAARSTYGAKRKKSPVMLSFKVGGRIIKVKGVGPVIRGRPVKFPKTPVILRVHGKRTKAPASANDLVAIFPDRAGTHDPNTMTCYGPIGEHSSCDANYSGSSTRPANAGEKKRLLDELVRAGYKRHELKIVARPASHHRAERVRQIGRGIR